MGVRGVVDGRVVSSGAALMVQEGDRYQRLAMSADQIAAFGARRPFAVSNGVAGRSARPVRSSSSRNAAKTIAGPKSAGLAHGLITGDCAKRWRMRSGQPWIDTVVQRYGPRAKVAALGRICAAQGTRWSCGRGINDAPALAAA